MTDASPEAWWSVERLRGGNGLVRGWGLRYITLSYACLGWEGRRTLAEAQAKREVSANDEEVKRKQDRHYVKKLTPLLFMCE